MRTRSKPAAKGATSTATTESRTITLPPSDNGPPKLAILPKGLSSDARVVTLPDPRKDTKNRYLVCPELGFFEFTKITASKGTPRSWLLKPEGKEGGTSTEGEISTNGGIRSNEEGYLVKEPDLLVATPIDAALLLLQNLAPVVGDSMQMFLALDDHLDAWAYSSTHAVKLLRDPRVRRTMESSMAAICDQVDAGDESMYRLSMDKLLRHLLQKAQRAAAAGLPSSMEEHFVKEALKAPFTQTAVSDAIAKADSTDSQNTTDSGYASATQISEDYAALPVATPTQLTPSDEVCRLQRLRTAFDFILQSYVPSEMCETLLDKLSSSKLVDYSPLDIYQARLDELKKQSQALRTLSENITRKRSADEDDEAAEIRAEKKRRKEEEEVKKKSETRALKQLKKVDTSGMKKLSSFFVKKPAK